MSFLYPYFLLLSLAVLVPIVIHLFNFHKFKQVLFTNVSLLKDIAIATKKQNKLYERLLLLFRCLSILFLAFLFAQPYIKNSDNQLVQEGNNAVVVVLDNSFSMQNVAEKGSMLETAKAKTEEILKEYSDNDVFCLLTMDMEGKHKHFVTKQSFMEFLKDVEISSASLPYSTLLNTAHKLLSLRNEKSKRVFFVSDFQLSSFDKENIKKDSTSMDLFLPLEAKNINNVYVDSVVFDRNIYQKGQKVDLTVKVRNVSKQDAEDLTLKLYVNDAQQSLVNLNIAKNASVDVPMSFVIQNDGVLQAKLSVNDNPVTYDDDFFFTLNIKDKINVLALNGVEENKYLQRLFSNNGEVSLDNMPETKIDFSKFSSYNVIILNSLHKISSGLAASLADFRKNGGSVVIFPAKDMVVEEYNASLSSLGLPNYSSVVKKELKVNRIDADNQLYRNVFTSVPDNMEMPIAKQYYKLLAKTNNAKKDIITYVNGDVFLLESAQENSKVYMFSVPLSEDYSNFTSQSIFVPTLWNMVLYSQNLSKPFVFTNSDDFIDLSLYSANIESETVKLKQENNNDYTIIPQMLRQNNRLGFKIQGQLKKSGFYTIEDGEKELGVLAVNYPREESDLRFLDAKTLEKELDALGLDNAKVFNDRKMISTYFSQSKKGFDFTYILLLLIVCSIGMEAWLLMKMRNDKNKQ